MTSKRPKVLLLVKADVRPVPFGGVDRVVDLLARELQNRGVKVIRPEQRIHPTMSASGRGGLELVRSIVRVAAVVRDSGGFRNGRLDGIVSNATLSSIPLALLRKLRVLRTHIVWVLHESLVAVAEEKYRTKHLRSLYLSIVCWLMRSCVVVAVSRDLSDEISRCCSSLSPLIVPNVVDAVDVRRRSLEPPEPELEHAFLASARPRTVSVGRISPEKGFDILVRAIAAHPSDSRPDVWILGEGPERENLVNLCFELGVDEQVKFVGQVEHPEWFIALSDRVIVPSRREAFSLVAEEARALAKPVLLSDCSARFREIGALPPNRVFQLSEAPESLARALQSLEQTEIATPSTSLSAETDALVEWSSAWMRALELPLNH